MKIDIARQCMLQLAVRAELVIFAVNAATTTITHKTHTQTILYVYNIVNIIIHKIICINLHTMHLALDKIIYAPARIHSAIQLINYIWEIINMLSALHCSAFICIIIIELHAFDSKWAVRAHDTYSRFCAKLE